MAPIDLRSPLLLNPESIQTVISYTGVKPGQGWRQVGGLTIGHLPGVVRFLISDESAHETRIFGSGTLIGVMNGDWLTICTASHVLEDIDRTLGLERRDNLSHLDTDEDRLRRRYDPELLKHVRCGIWLPELGTEIICPLVNVETSKVIRRRDTALVFVKLTPEAAGKADPIPIDVGPPPIREWPLHVAGFNALRVNESVPVNAPGLVTPERHLILREGFTGGYGRHAGVEYDVVQILIPIDGGMSGGPVIIYRPEPFQAQPVVVAIINGELGSSLNPQSNQSANPIGFATPVAALFTHEVFLPSNEWIPFREAVERKIIATSGPEVYHVPV